MLFANNFTSGHIFIFKNVAKYTLTLLLIAASVRRYACITCNRQIQEGRWNSQFYPNLLTMLSAFIVLAVIVVLLSRISAKRHMVRLSANPNIQNHSPVPLTTASMVLGIGWAGLLMELFYTRFYNGMKCCRPKFRQRRD
jgi:mannose/fructose/N-acetylgalactosamine-specific phosphotransferase system component IIC